jgi:hypothetical protein
LSYRPHLKSDAVELAARLPRSITGKIANAIPDLGYPALLF